MTAPAPGEDADLPVVRLAQAGDYAAFESLVAKFERPVYSLARRIAGRDHDAEDVVQQTFISVVEHLGEFRGEARFSTWLMRIATNHALALLRKRARHETASLDEASGGDDYAPVPHPQYIAVWRETPAEVAAQRETRQLIEAALDELDEKYRLAFVLRDVEGLSTAETAAALGISEANVKVRLLRARLMLRERLTRQFGDEATRVAPHEH